MSTNLSHSNKEIYCEGSFDKATVSPTTKDLFYENMLHLFIFYGHACMCVLFRGECDLFLQITLHLTFQDMVSYLTWILPFWLGWRSSIPLGPSCLFPHYRCWRMRSIINACLHACMPKLRSPCFYSRQFTHSASPDLPKSSILKDL